MGKKKANPYRTEDLRCSDEIGEIFRRNREFWIERNKLPIPRKSKNTRPEFTQGRRMFLKIWMARRLKRLSRFTREERNYRTVRITARLVLLVEKHRFSVAKTSRRLGISPCYGNAVYYRFCWHAERIIPRGD